MIRNFSIALFLSVLVFSGCEKTPGQDTEPEVVDDTKEDVVKWDKWQEGYLDIHHLSTGCGDCIFIIMPDGTTMMVDAGNKIENDDNHPGQLPNTSKTTGEWIENYVSHFESEAGFQDTKHLDYLLVTHFHDDHIGSISSTSRCTMSQDGTYAMTGVSRVANLLKIDKIIDRDYPDYCNPVGTSIYDDSTTKNYLKFISSFTKGGGNVEKFEVGSTQQFKTLKKQVDGFGIRNIYSTGVYVKKSGGVSDCMVPSGISAEELRENLMSCVINVSYGKFDYHCGGDIENDTELNDWTAVEKNVGSLIGETDVVNLDHHGNKNSTCKDFVELTRPQVFVASQRSVNYPSDDVLDRIYNQAQYVGLKDMYVGCLNAVKEEKLSAKGIKYKASGHTVVRVYPGGSTFRIFVFDSSRTDFLQIFSSALYTSR